MRLSLLPRFPLTSIALAVGVTLLQGCASSGGSKVAEVPNPYMVAVEGQNPTLKVNTLRAFGDSYTDVNFTNANKTGNWVVELGGMTSANARLNYAIGGARAASANYKAFNRQIDTMQNKGQNTFADGDLTIVYFGYNDIGRTATADELVKPRKDYQYGIDRLVAQGATAENRRLFVTQLHDWSRNPGVEDGAHSKVVFWNQYVADLANAYENVIAVDLFTPFERIYAEPELYGFTNVTSADSKRSAIDALYNDQTHFGTKGQQIIARVYYHYLTRGWDWANTLQAGAQSAAQLNEDIDKRLITLFNETRSPLSSGWSLVPIGSPEQRSSALPTSAFGASATSLKSKDLMGNAISKDNSANGLAFDFAGKQDPASGKSAHFGVALTQSDISRKLAGLEDRNLNQLSSDATTVYWQQPMGNFLMTTQLARHDLTYANSANDDLLNRTVHNGGRGEVWSFESKIRRPMETGNFLITPWASLTTYRQKLGAYTAQTLYTVDTRYEMNALTDVYAGIGFDLQSQPISVGRGMSLTFGGGLSHSMTTYRSAARVTMTEVERNFSQSENLDRSRIERTRLGLNADLAVSRNVNLTAGYAAHLQDVKGTQTVSLRANVSF